MDHGICVRLFSGGAKSLIQHDEGYAVALLSPPAIAAGDDLQGRWLAPGRRCVWNSTRRAYVEVTLLGNWGTPFAAIRANGGM